MFLAVQEAFGWSSSAADTRVRVISVDSSSIGAHQHAAGARKDVLTGTSTQGAASNDPIPRPEPDDHALGRSRGGWTTKIHALVDHVMRPVGVILGPGHAGDNPQLVPLLDDYHGVHGSRRLHVFR